MRSFNKILIANRGEIAVRIARTAKEMGISTVGIYSTDDHNSGHVNDVDMAFDLGSGTLKETYLDIGKIIDIAKYVNCDAIHPGYGFLSEDHEFAEACQEADIAFIGPYPGAIKLMGNKIKANNYVRELGIPVLQGITGSREYLLGLNRKISYPSLIKASAGGGGKGMRIIRSKNDLYEAIESASREAESYFGNGTIYIERYLENPRHIEIQILGDKYGNIIHLYERECSIQRHYQKIIEEAPSISLSDQLRNKIISAAVKIASSIRYESAGTVEFLLDGDMKFYFLEMNTRIQVEHPVTELITGIDIVREQILIAAGKKLSFSQDDIRISGHAIEARIYAEDTLNNFSPSPGRINYYHKPTCKNLRIDSEIQTGNYFIGHQYDPLLAKYAVHGENRLDAIQLLLKSINETVIHGIHSNLSFIKALVKDENYLQNNLSVNYANRLLKKILLSSDKEKKDIKSVLAAIVFIIHKLTHDEKSNDTDTIWNYIGLWRHIMNVPLEFDENCLFLEYQFRSKNIVEIMVDDKLVMAELISLSFHKIFLRINKSIYSYIFSSDHNGTIWISNQNLTYKFARKDILSAENHFNEYTSSEKNAKIIVSPMPGKILEVLTKENSIVKKNDPIVIIDSMKLENKILATITGKILKIHVNEGDQVKANMVLIEIE